MEPAAFVEKFLGGSWGFRERSDRRIPFKVICLFSEFSSIIFIQLKIPTRGNCLIGFLTDL